MCAVVDYALFYRRMFIWKISTCTNQPICADVILLASNVNTCGSAMLLTVWPLLFHCCDIYLIILITLRQ